MIKNLLILKNELVSLEIVPSSSPSNPDPSAASGGMQHFSQIWESTLSLSSSGQAAVFGFLAGLGSYIPRPFSSPSPTPPPAASSRRKDGEAGEKDANHNPNPSDQLDDLLRQSIYAFTSRWGGLLSDARLQKHGARPPAKVEKELEDLLDRAFAQQPEVVAKLKEAVWASAEALAQEARKKGGRG